MVCSYFDSGIDSDCVCQDTNESGCQCEADPSYDLPPGRELNFNDPVVFGVDRAEVNPSPSVPYDGSSPIPPIDDEDWSTEELVPVPYGDPDYISMEDTVGDELYTTLTYGDTHND